MTIPFEFNCKGKAIITIAIAEAVQKVEVNCPDNYMLEAEQFGRSAAGTELPLISAENSLGNASVIDEILSQISHE